MRDFLNALFKRGGIPPPQPTPSQSCTEKDAHLSGWFLQESGELFQGFDICPNHVVLDIGCGDGPFALFCAERGAEIYFADIDPQKVDAVAKLLENTPARAVHPVVTDANPVPIGCEKIDRIIAMEVLEHVEDPRSFMNELVRVGKPGALYLFTVPDPAGENVQRKLAPPSYFEHPNHIRVFERGDFSELVEASGLIIEKRAYYGFYWSMWWFFFWACKQDLAPPWHPLLESWNQTWGLLLSTESGSRIKQALDETIPKSQAIIARKPLENERKRQ